MSEKIQAEDAKEWAAWLVIEPAQRQRQLGFARDEVDSDGYCDIRLLAAKALHGQPFGFTWEDVDLLRNHTMALTDWNEPDPDRDTLIESIANRIAALLPPRGAGA